MGRLARAFGMQGFSVLASYLAQIYHDSRDE